ncbi:hypothetical protein [Nitrosomonas sp. Is79A3]
MAQASGIMNLRGVRKLSVFNLDPTGFGRFQFSQACGTSLPWICAGLAGH